MAKVRRNIVVQGLSGSLGDQLVLKQDKAGRTIVSVKPTFDEHREFSEAQKEVHESFREAVAYAKAAKSEAVYQQKADGTPQNAYNVALADWFHSPQILEVDLNGWSGKAGEVIRIKALDDVQVKLVTVVITAESGTLLEQGAAVRANDPTEAGLWWEYTTSASASGNAQVLVSAEDLPGHIAQMTKSAA